MRIVVIGASGNLGSAILRRLQVEDRVDEIVGVSRRRPAPDFAPGVSWQQIDVSARDAARRLGDVVAGADAVVHLAWALQPSHDEPLQHRVDVGGTAAVLEAVAERGVRHLLVASSVGAYSSASKEGRVDESYPTGGLHTSTYSRHKAENERAFDAFEEAHPDIALTRFRPGLVFQRSAATEIAGLFLGRRVPTRWMGGLRLPVLPIPREIVFQAVHSDDVADAFWRAIDIRASGAFNLAAEPVLTPERIASVLGTTKTVPLPLAALRGVVQATWRLRVQPTDAGWIDIAANVPIMSTERARSMLGWTPRVDAVSALRELIDGLGGRARDESSPPLHG